MFPGRGGGLESTRDHRNQQHRDADHALTDQAAADARQGPTTVAALDARPDDEKWWNTPRKSATPTSEIFTISAWPSPVVQRSCGSGSRTNHKVGPRPEHERDEHHHKPREA